MIEDDELRIYVVVRRDIGDVLSKPKFGVQCAHAVLSVWGKCTRDNPYRAYEYFSCANDKIDSGQAKIILQVKDGDELLALADKARELGHPVATITDAGRTELPEPTLTAIAIGPIWHKAEGTFLKRVRLYQADKVSND
jgi:PTH2 family peptidyl-tRNA hydrolase